MDEQTKFFDPNMDPNAPPEGVDPEQWAQYVAMQQILAGSTYGDEMDMLGKQRATAEALRYQDSPEGRQAGRVYVAANPLEHLGRGIQQYKAQKQLGEYDKKFGELTEAEKARGAAALEGLGYGKPKPKQPGQESLPAGYASSDWL
jgi:hypothetical protein